jgi:hypothetical protein
MEETPSEKLPVPRLVKKIPRILLNSDSLPRSQQPANRSYPDTNKYSPRPLISRHNHPFQYYPPIYSYVFDSLSFLQIFQTK